MKFKAILIQISLLLGVGLLLALNVEAAHQVTMASYDFDGDYVDEIIRTDESNGSTVIRIYKRIDDSFFYKPIQTFKVLGRLVQVPEIVDVNGDGSMDYFFAAGSDMGIIYYDIFREKFERTNDFGFKLEPPEDEVTKEEISSKDATMVPSLGEVLEENISPEEM